MKMKIMFYIALAICLIQSCFWLFFPFMGPVTVMRSIKEGLFGPADQELANNAHMQLSAVSQFFSSAFTFVYFFAIFTCSLLVLFYKMRADLKYKTGIILATVSIFILFAVKIINTYML